MGKVVIEGIELRYVSSKDIILPDDNNNRVKVAKLLVDKIDVVSSRLVEFEDD